MNHFIFLLSIASSLLQWQQGIYISNPNNQQYVIIDTIPGLKSNGLKPQIDPANLFTVLDAKKILGEDCSLTDSTTSIQANKLEYKCAFTTNNIYKKNEKAGNVYFLFEQYAKVLSAKEVYASIKKSNQHHEGIKVLHDLGDEAYFHSDGQNFYFIIVRKGEKMIRMKVNKITSTTSPDEINLISKRIAALL